MNKKSMSTPVCPNCLPIIVDEWAYFRMSDDTALWLVDKFD